MATRSSIDALSSLNPPSPALTNPDLLLPARDLDGILLAATSSPPQLSSQASSQRKQPPSPPDSEQHHPGHWTHGTQLAGSQPSLNYSMPLRASPSLSNATSTTDSTLRRHFAQYKTDAIASSPILKDPPVARLKPTWQVKPSERRWSNGSGSVHSDDIENMHWPDFEGPSEVDTESVVLEDEEEEQPNGLPKIADGDESVIGAEEPYTTTHIDSFEEDPLSRRADLILANAKKRLHAMEGNLRGARNSLLLSAPSSPNSAYFSQMSGDFGTTLGKERPRYQTSAGMYGHRSRPHDTSPFSSNNLGHTRLRSDASSGLGVPGARGNQWSVPKRSSSALGSFAHGLNSLEKSASLRGVRSQQDMRQSRLQNWIEESSGHQDPPRPASQQTDVAPHSRTPSMDPYKRSPSAASSLRFQMDELKGRINNLKAKAHEDRAKRLSITSEAPSSPLTASRHHDGNGWSPSNSPSATQFQRPAHSPPHVKKHSDGGSVSSRSQGTVEHNPHYDAESTYEDAQEEVLTNIQEEPEDGDEPEVAAVEEQKVLMGPQDPTNDELYGSGSGKKERDFYGDEQEDEDVDEDEAESILDTQSIDGSSLDGQSEYFETVTVPAERHEDRADAFDYENFFLHSAMGSYSRDRRSSFSSESSVETTRPASPRPRPATAVESKSEDDEKRPQGSNSVKQGYAVLVQASPGLHRRSQSVESISTVATFETATEGADNSDDEDDDGNEALDAATQHYLSPPHTLSPAPPSSPKRMLDSGVHIPPRDASSGADYAAMEQNELASALVSSMLGIETSGSKGVPAHDLELVEGLMSSLQLAVGKLQGQEGDDEYARKEWRRRIDAARRALVE